MRVRHALGVTCLASAFAIALGVCDRGTPGTSNGARPGQAPLRPLVDIGGEGGPEELSGVTGAVSLSDGRIVIGNGATNEIRFFSADGDYLETIGRRGGGPGEFYSLLWVGVAPGDTILAYDIRTQRLSWFAPDGRYVRGTQVDTHLWSGSIIGQFADGSLVVVSNSLPLPRSRPEGLGIDTIALLRFSPDGGRSASVASLPAWEMYWAGRGAAMVGFGFPVYRKLQVVVCDSSVIAGYSDSARVWRIGADGQRLGALALPLNQRAIPAAERARMTRERVAGASPDFRARIEAAINAGDVLPAKRPLFSGLGSDGTGTLWVGLSADEHASSSEWVRFTPNGDVIDTVRLAPRARFASTAGDRLIVVSRDEDDVQHVIVYRIPQLPARAGARSASVATGAASDPGCGRGFYSALGRG